MIRAFPLALEQFSNACTGKRRSSRYSTGSGSDRVLARKSAFGSTRSLPLPVLYRLLRRFPVHAIANRSKMVRASFGQDVSEAELRRL